MIVVIQQDAIGRWVHFRPSHIAPPIYGVPRRIHIGSISVDAKTKWRQLCTTTVIILGVLYHIPLNSRGSKKGRDRQPNRIQRVRSHPPWDHFQFHSRFPSKPGVCATKNAVLGKLVNTFPYMSRRAFSTLPVIDKIGLEIGPREGIIFRDL